MKQYDWDQGKNAQLKQQHGVTFEEIVFQISQGFEVDVFRHPNQKKYPGQMVSVVILDDYAYLVPYVESDNVLFLKTIIPSRKATKKYLG